MHVRAAIPVLARVAAASSAVTRHCALGRLRRAPLSHASRFYSSRSQERSAQEQAVEAEADAARAGAEATRSKEHRWPSPWTAVVTGGTLALGIALGIDWVLHDSRTYLKWRVKEALKGGELVEVTALPLAATLQLDHPPLLVQETVRPTLLFGPSGCGKSAYVQRVALENVKGSSRKPTALVKFRLPQDSRGGSGSMSLDDGAVLAECVAASVCKQLHIPLRSSLLSSIRSVKLTTDGTVDAFVAMRMNQARDRLARAQFAISILFEAAEEVSKDTRVRPLLIFDEAHDLVRNPTLSKLGGRDLFNQLGTAAVWYGIERKTIHFVGVGSSSLFISYWAETTPLAGARVSAWEMPDPSREQLVEALTTKRENGEAYSTEDANKLLDACGQRLRLVEEAFGTEDAAEQPVAEIIARVYRSAESSVNTLFRSLDLAGQAKLVKLLDAIVEADSDATRTRPSLSAVPFKLHVTDMPSAALRVLYVDDADKLHFQSDAVRAVWKAARPKYAAAD